MKELDKLSSREAASFLGISVSTLNRLRDLERIRYYRIGFRVIYSVQNHLKPFLENCERNRKNAPFYLDPCECKAKKEEGDNE